MDDPLSQQTVPSVMADWPADLQRDFAENAFNGCVGNVLVSETDRLRVWHLRLPPGQRCNVHRHVNSYFWSAMNAGKSRAYFDDGRILDSEYYPGQSKHFTFGPGEFMVHCLENTGDTDLLFATVEFIDGVNLPLPIPDWVRLKSA